MTFTTFNGELYPAAAYNYYVFDILIGYNGYYAGQFDLLPGLGGPNDQAMPAAASLSHSVFHKCRKRGIVGNRGGFCLVLTRESSSARWGSTRI
jgi:hypothetical protein